MAARKVDLVGQFLGSIVTVEATSRRGKVWLRDHTDASNPSTGVNYCDHRPGRALLQGALDAGLTVQDGASGRTQTGGEL